MKDRAEAAAAFAGPGGRPRPAPARAAAGLVAGVAAAASALAAGAGLVGAALAWAPPRGDSQAISRGARLYAAECAGCHGPRLEGQAVEGQAVPTRPGVRPARTAPPLAVTGHAWRHPDAELAAIVAHGTETTASPKGTPGMPAFAGRLDPGEIDAVLAYVKSRWPTGLRAYQAALDPGGGETLAGLLRDPAWAFPGQCPLPPAATGDP